MHRDHPAKGDHIMRQIARVFVPLLLLCTASPRAQTPAEPPYGGPTAGAGRIYHLEYLRVLPGRSADYDRFVKSIFKPMLDAMVARGVWTRYSFLTVPYHGAAPCADYNYVFVAQMRDFASVDREQKSWAEI